MTNIEIDWQKLRKKPFAETKKPLDWPQDVESISLEGLSLLGIDKENHLYWDGKKIEIRKRISWRKWEIAGAILVTLGSGLVPILDFFLLLAKTTP